MAEDTQVETAVTEQAPSAPASTPAPATTPPQVDVDSLKATLKEEVRRELQSTKDKEVVNLHKQYQERERVIREQAKARLARHDENDASQFDRDMESMTVVDQARAIVQQQAAAESSRRQANDIAEVFGLKGNDPRLMDCSSWDEFRDKAKKAAAEDRRKELETERLRESEAARKATDVRVASGELGTLDVSPAPLQSTAGTIDSITDQLNQLMRSPTKNAAKIKELSKKLGELS